MPESQNMQSEDMHHNKKKFFSNKFLLPNCPHKPTTKDKNVVIRGMCRLKGIKNVVTSNPEHKRCLVQVTFTDAGLDE